MGRVGWRFSEVSFLFEEQGQFEEAVLKFLKGTVPKGFELIKTTFSGKSESVYLCFASLASQQWFKVRISSHENMRLTAYENFNTLSVTDVKEFRKVFKQRLAEISKDVNLLCHFDLETFRFLKHMSAFTDKLNWMTMALISHLQEDMRRGRLPRVLFKKVGSSAIEGAMVDDGFRETVRNGLRYGILDTMPMSSELYFLIPNSTATALQQFFFPDVQLQIHGEGLLKLLQPVVDYVFLETNITDLWSFKEDYFLCDYSKEIPRLVGEVLPEGVEVLDAQYDRRGKQVRLIVGKSGSIACFVVAERGRPKQGDVVATHAYKNVTTFQSALKRFIQRLPFLDYDLNSYLVSMLIHKTDVEKTQLKVFNEVLETRDSVQYLTPFISVGRSAFDFSSLIREGIERGIFIALPVGVHHQSIHFSALGGELFHKTKPLYQQRFVELFLGGELPMELQLAFSGMQIEKVPEYFAHREAVPVRQPEIFTLAVSDRERSEVIEKIREVQAKAKETVLQAETVKFLSVTMKTANLYKRLKKLLSETLPAGYTLVSSCQAGVDGQMEFIFAHPQKVIPKVVIASSDYQSVEAKVFHPEDYAEKLALRGAIVKYLKGRPLILKRESGVVTFRISEVVL